MASRYEMSLYDLFVALNNATCTNYETNQIFRTNKNRSPDIKIDNDNLIELIAPELIEIRHELECVQVAYLGGGDTRLAYIGKTESMRQTVASLQLPKFPKLPSTIGESAFLAFGYHLQETEDDNVHFEYDIGRTEKGLLFVLKKLIKVYELQDSNNGKKIS
ncbi:hypothetical protein J4211_04500 [Candidatus Woesearchaeota archaeon]|nr:hypothetical protein [Candidatus Woesearchaeota archaeon]